MVFGIGRIIFQPRGAAHLGVAALAVLTAHALAADAPAAPSAEDFARPAVTDSIKFSPDGTRFAAVVERQGQMVLAVVDFATNKGRSFSSDRGSDLASYRWITDDLIAIRTTKYGVRQFDLSRNDFLPAYVSVDGKSRLDAYKANSALRRVPDAPTDIVVARRSEVLSSQELEVVDSLTGQFKRRLTTEHPGPRIREWVLDRGLNPRAAIGYNIRSRKDEVWWRASVDAKWGLLTAFDPRSERGFYPVAMDGDDKLLVLSNLATGRFALHRIDERSGMPGELLAGHAGVDIDDDDLIYGPDRLAPIGVSIDADKESAYWFDDQRAALQRTIDASLPSGSVNRLRFLPQGRVLVHSYSDIEPGAYYFYDPTTHQLSEWSRSKPWLRPEQMGRTEILRSEARDGQVILSYLTIPRNAPAGGALVPLLVWVHGGPSGRDRWGFDPMVQFLASRGYAVLQPNFRGSSGFGHDFEAAGSKQWGRRMQDDVTDAVQAVLRQGRIDRDRICIGGASYGGYAALMGVIREPDLFRCAIDMAGPTDLIGFVESPTADYNRRTNTYLDREIEDSLKQQVGDPDDPAERRAMQANSPLRRAAEIKVPVLMLYGTADRRVPLEHGTSMRDALQASGGRVEWKSYSGEGHGIWDRKNSVDVMVRSADFLARSIGAGVSK